MRSLEELTKDFKVSRPIFRLTRERDGGKIDVSDPVYQYRPEPEQGNLLSELVCEHYREAFNIQRGEFSCDPYDIANRAMEEIRNSIPKFLEKNLEMKAPRQSKIYKWFAYEKPNDYYFNDVLVMVYKYLRSFSDSDMRANNLEHANNAVALLEAIMEKYGKR
jgi:hypothetical protein